MADKKFYEGGIYHVFNKSIANYKIFSDSNNSFHFLEILDYYNDTNLKISLSKEKLLKNEYRYQNLLVPKGDSILKFISYCIMPDHFHLLVKVLYQQSIYHYLNTIENSYTHFFNKKFERKGPLWQSTYKMVEVKSDEQLLHLTRYIHINPTTSFLVEKPEDWTFSSYRDLVTNKEFLKGIVTEISISDPRLYQQFCENNIDYQRKLKIIKKLLID